jgi:hypothetical protein
MLDAGTDPNASLLGNGVPVLESVLSYGFKGLAELFVARGAKVRPGLGLDAAGFSGNLPLLQWVFSSGVDVHVGVTSKFLSATKVPSEAKLAIAEYFLSIGADPQAWAEASMIVPGCLPIAKMLVSKGLFDVKAKTSVIRRGGVLDERVSIEDFLAMRNIDHPYTLALLPDKSNALFVAIRSKDDVAVKALLAGSPPPDINTPLHKSTGSPLEYATKSGSAAIVSTLLAAGAQGGDAATMVIAAAEAGAAEVLHLLLTTRPAPVAATLVAALHKAIRGEYIAVVDMLLAAGANVHVVVDNVPALGVVPLLARTASTIAKPVHVQLIHVLLRGGANPDAYVPVLYNTVKKYCVYTCPALAVAVGWA